MASSSLPHAFTLSFLVLAFASSFTLIIASSVDNLHTPYHSQPSSAAPAPAPTHHHHSLPPSPAPAPVHHHHHHHSLAPSPSPIHHHHHLSLAPSPAPIHHHHHSLAPSPAPTHGHHHHSLPPSPAHPPSYHPSKPPTYPPVKPPSHSPAVKPPTHSPVVKPPTHSPGVKPPSYSPPSKAPVPAPAPYIMPPRKLVAVQGVVYCKNCSYSGVNTLLGSSPLSGATVELRCRNTKYLIKKASTTDKNGYFFLEAPKYITTYGAHKCKVFLLEKPKNSGPCSHATDLNGGVSGAFLFLNKKLAPPSKPQPFTLFNVGPFAFEPSKCYKH